MIDVQFTERSSIERPLTVMRPLVAIIVVFGFLVWDMSRNHGHYFWVINATVEDLIQQASLR